MIFFGIQALLYTQDLFYLRNFVFKRHYKLFRVNLLVADNLIYFFLNIFKLFSQGMLSLIILLNLFKLAFF